MTSVNNLLTVFYRVSRGLFFVFRCCVSHRKFMLLKSTKLILSWFSLLVAHTVVLVGSMLASTLIALIFFFIPLKSSSLHWFAFFIGIIFGSAFGGALLASFQKFAFKDSQLKNWLIVSTLSGAIGGLLFVVYIHNVPLSQKILGAMFINGLLTLPLSIPFASLAQWWLLRRTYKKAKWWLLANLSGGSFLLFISLPLGLASHHYRILKDTVKPIDIIHFWIHYEIDSSDHFLPLIVSHLIFSALIATVVVFVPKKTG